MRNLRSNRILQTLLQAAPFVGVLGGDVAWAQESSEESNETAPVELEGVVVEGKLVEAPAAAPHTSHSVDAEELERFEDDDVHQVMLKVPGVQIRGEDGVGLRPNIGIRGTSPNRSTKVVLMEDGILLGPAPYSAPAAYYFPLITRMRAVEIHKGGAQLRFGPRAMGGAIDLRTVEVPSSGWRGTADVAGGEYGYFKAHATAGYGAEQTGFILEGLHLQSNGFKDLDGGGNTGFDKNEFMARWRLNSSPDAEIYQQLDVKFGLATERSNETYLGLSDDDFRASPYRRYAASAPDEMNWTRGQAQLTYSVFPSDSLELRATAYRHQFTRDWFKVDSFNGVTLDEVLANPSSPSNIGYYNVLTGEADSTSSDEQLLYADNYRWYTSQGIQTHAFWDVNSGPLEHHVEGGLRYHFDEVNRQHTGYTYDMVGSGDGEVGRPVATDLPTTALARNQGKSHAISAHVVDTLLWEKWTFTPGLRLEVVWTQYEDYLDESLDNSRTQVGLLPGLGVHYALTDELGLLAGAYRGFGPVAPQAKDPSESDPKPESSTTWEGGGRFTSAKAHAELIGYLNHYNNLTANCTQAIGCSSDQVGQQYDGGKVNVWGLEALLGYEASAGDFIFPLRANYAFTQSAFRGDPFDSANPEWGSVEPGDELPYLPRHQGSAGAGIADDERWALDVNGTFVARSREVAGSGSLDDAVTTDAYAILAIAGKVRTVSQLWLYAKVSNLFNSAYLTSRRPHGARPGAPQWFQFGAKYEY